MGALFVVLKEHEQGFGAWRKRRLNLRSWAPTIKEANGAHATARYPDHHSVSI